MHRETLDVAAFLASFEKTACFELAQPYRVGPSMLLAYQLAVRILWNGPRLHQTLLYTSTLRIPGQDTVPWPALHAIIVLALLSLMLDGSQD